MKTNLSSEQLELIAKPLPPQAVKPHPTRAGMSTIKAVFVTERFNDVFGVGGCDSAFFNSVGDLRGFKGSLHEGGIREIGRAHV